MSIIGKFLETESKWVVVQGLGQEGMGVTTNEYEDSLGW